MKIDVQGLEPEVLRGLAVTLARDLPVVWLEVAAGTQSSMARLTDLEALFSYPIRVELMEGGNVKPVLETGNYLVYPAGSTGLTARALCDLIESSGIPKWAGF